ncbi:methylaspartate mutase subunit E [Chitinophaga japonensis]|uniref:Glutamate mutase subunit E n=1 Tax=Chitinophaga japonensis TaxID=104662 RepID=A0A562SM27_CHIJA|nr:methylaspartate mutase subunit E [Chitinophaga japonensis]TWI82133.1 glutamate mutase subunit E [Chitinophaga japonensis]
MSEKHAILIGGIGDDAHSVGIGLLELGFREAGFYVKSLGIRNSLHEFFRHAPYFDAILISNKNGHAELYLQDFQRLMSEYLLKEKNTKLWYLGGSLSVSESDFSIKKRFLDMGFTNVYPRPVPFSEVLNNIKRDLEYHNIPKRNTRHRFSRMNKQKPINWSEVHTGRLSAEQLETERREVLQEWPTGTDVMYSEYQKVTAVTGTLDDLLWNNKVKSKTPLFQPRTGVANIEDQIELLQYLESEGSDISSVQLDAASRSRLYQRAEEGRLLSIERKSSQLNGFPIPIYGVGEVRRLLLALKNPFQLRGGGPDHRFTYEIALKAGVSALEGGFVCYCLPYDKLTSPVESFKRWQFVDRLAARYHEMFGIAINREYFGVLTATLIEPSLAIIVNIIQAISSARQGIVSISVGYAEQGNRSQDIAAVTVLEELVNYYLRKFNFTQCRVTTVYHQFMAAFPADYKKAEELIFNSSATATLAGATKVMVKTAVEAIRIPDRYDNAKAVMLSKRGALSADKSMLNSEKVQEEKQLIRKEVQQVMDVIMELGSGDVIKGAILAIEQGVIDIPWSPNIYNRNRVVCVRDTDGAVRFYDFGNLPFSESVKDFHQEKVHKRKTMERDPSIFSLLEKDLSRIWKNEYQRWPLDGHYVT